MELYDVCASHYGAAIVSTGSGHHVHKKTIAKGLHWDDAFQIQSVIATAHGAACQQAGDDFGSRSDQDGGTASNIWQAIIEKYDLR